MKVNRNDTIQISGRITSSGFFRGLKEGSRVISRILERIDSRHAMLEIGGKKIRAEFLNGIPAGKRIDLVLEKRTSSFFRFRMVTDEKLNASVRELLGYTVFKLEQLGENNVRILGKLVKQGLDGLFHLNDLLLGLLRGSKDKRKSTTEVFNRLLGLGVSVKKLTFFSYIFAAMKGINLNLLFSIFSIPGFIDNGVLNEIRQSLKDKKKFQQYINNFIDEIEKVVDDGNDSGFLDDLFSCIIGDRPGDGKFSSIEIPCNGPDGFRPVRLIYSDDALVLALEFSNLGRVEILTRDTGTVINILVTCSNDESLQALKSNFTGLEKRLHSIIKKAVKVSFLGITSVTGDVMKINSVFISENILDMRV